MKLQCLELMGISITRDALYKRVERQSMKKPNAPTRPVEELALNQNDIDVSSISSPSTGSNITTAMMEAKIYQMPWSLHPKQEDLRVARIRRREKTSRITKNV